MLKSSNKQIIPSKVSATHVLMVSYQIIVSVAIYENQEGNCGETLLAYLPEEQKKIKLSWCNMETLICSVFIDILYVTLETSHVCLKDKERVAM